MQGIGEVTGLTDQQVEESRRLHGGNILQTGRRHTILRAVGRALKEPMLILLFAASAVYFISGSIADGLFMVFAIVMVSIISLYQESRSRNAIRAIKQLSQPKIKLIRNRTTGKFPIEEIVVGDYFIVEEGEIVPADGTIIQANDFSLNEAIITGESFPIARSALKDNLVLRGTQVLTGSAVCQATRTGMQTRIGQIGKSIEDVQPAHSPLQVQLKDFVRKMALTGIAIFIAIWLVGFLRTYLFTESFMHALTLAMSVLPEEIPVAFSTFMALGAWRLTRAGIIVKDTRTIETLGCATVICIDKTGTITKNEMSLAAVYDYSTHTVYASKDFARAKGVITAAMWASESRPFDPMEKALHQAYAQVAEHDFRPRAVMVHEYPLSGTPPFMTHVFQDEHGNRTVATKGAPESVMRLCNLSPSDIESINQVLNDLLEKGYRVLAVADAHADTSNLPQDQHEFSLAFRGLVAFHDPPKENIASVLEKFYKAGIIVKLITGDHTTTTKTIASEINFKKAEDVITGEDLLRLPESERIATINNTNIFTRMFPEAKLKVVEALKKQDHIVAMTGDGVNDGPALRAAHIGIAMGKKGSEVAKEVSDLVLSNDDLSGMVEAVAAGRKIYDNLKKAIQYVISIHIPIILIVFVPLVLAWPYPAVFAPVHVIFLELIMGPTCSIIYENEPIEPGIMHQKPRVFSKSFFKGAELITSLVQGLAISVGLLYIYWYAVLHHQDLETTTSMIFLSLISANLILTLVNRSFFQPAWVTITYKNKLLPLILAVTITVVTIILNVPVLRAFFAFGELTFSQAMVSMAAGVVSVIWFEVVKWRNRLSQSSSS